MTTFLTFLQTRCGVAIACTRNEIFTLVSTFRNLLSMREYQSDDFIKSTRSANSVRAAQQCLLVPSGDIKMLKVIYFELEDRRKCNALYMIARLQGVTDADITIFRQKNINFLKNKINTRMQIGL